MLPESVPHLAPKPSQLHVPSAFGMSSCTLVCNVSASCSTISCTPLRISASCDCSLTANTRANFGITSSRTASWIALKGNGVCKPNSLLQMLMATFGAVTMILMFCLASTKACRASARNFAGPASISSACRRASCRPAFASSKARSRDFCSSLKTRALSADDFASHLASARADFNRDISADKSLFCAAIPASFLSASSSSASRFEVASSSLFVLSCAC
mmetsp:Transcript_68536/g.164603  ORF Transcript_68536/g.164603 Transcript_68536/m.164603 type:complete len:218 (+) Transcript_68536:343-996(+)